MEPAALRRVFKTRSLRYSGALALGYLIVAGIYILVSSRFAALMAETLEDLERVERTKGLLFVVTTSMLLFGLAFVLFRRLEKSAEELARSREALLQAERVATTGLFAASIAHDIRNLLMVLRSGTELLREDVGEEGEGQAILDDMSEALARASELAKRLGEAGRGSAFGVMAEVDVAETLREAIGFLKLHDKFAGCTLHVHVDGPVRATVYPALVHQLLTNLMLNAIEAVKGAGLIEVRLARAGEEVCLEVHDDGPGVPEDVREKLFDAFFTTKEHGTGLGLLSVKACAQMHGGSVEVSRSPLGGACFAVRLRSLERSASALRAS